MLSQIEFDLWEKEVHLLADNRKNKKEILKPMSAKTEKQRRKMIKAFILEHKDMVLEDVTDSLLALPLLSRLLYAFTLVTKCVPRRGRRK